MASLIYYRNNTLSDPVATWDSIELGIATLEESLNDSDSEFVYTPFVPGTRTETWVLTKTEIQDLEDRIHTIAEYIGIPHLLTTWAGLMPINYNALNHIIMGLMPLAWIAAGFDTDGSLAAIIPEGYSLPDIDYLETGVGDWPLQVYDKLDMSFYVDERYHIYVAVVFNDEITFNEENPVSHFILNFYGSDHIEYDANIVMVGASVLSLDRTIVLVDAVIDPMPAFIRVMYDGLADIVETVSDDVVPAFFLYSVEGPS